MMKANGIIIIGISVAMVITGCGNNTKEFILDGYKSCDEYFDDGFKKYTDYCKYYYDKSFDVTFSENSYYTVVSKDYVKVIKQYFNNFQSEFVERFLELSLFYGLSSPLNSEMICIFPYF